MTAVGGSGETHATRSTLGQMVDRVVRHPVLAVAAVAVPVVVANVWWASNYRHIGSVTGDEAVYSNQSFRLYRDLTLGEWGDFWRDVSRTPPLVPLLTLPALVVGSDSITSLLAVQSILLAFCAVAVAAITHRLAGARIALVAGFAALLIPAGIHAVRSLDLAFGASAAMIAAIWALLASDRCQKPAQMATFGVAVGVMLLAWPMTVAFVPCLAVAVALQIRRNRRGGINLGIASAAALVIAGPWWIGRWSANWGYLVGSTSGEPGSTFDGTSLPSRPLFRTLDLVLAFGVPPLICGLAVLVVVVRASRDRLLIELRNPSTRFSRDVATLVAVPVVGYMVLLLVSNYGQRFTLPLTYPIIVAIGALSTRVSITARRRIAATIVASGIITQAMSLAGPLDVETVGIVGNLNLFDAHGSGDYSTDSERIVEKQRWEAAKQTVAKIDSYVRDDRSVFCTVVGFDPPFIDASAIHLANLRRVDKVPGNLCGAIGDRVSDSMAEYAPRRDGAANLVVGIQSKAEVAGSGSGIDPMFEYQVKSGLTVKDLINLPSGGRISILTHPDWDPDAR